MRQLACRIIATLLMLVGLVSVSFGQDRIALVVGIDNYAKLNPLQKATNDARAVSTTLRNLGFGVDLALDVDRRSFNKAISDFLNKIKPGAIAYFHYSGHGVSIDNDTYLIPADMELPTSNDREFVKREAIRLSELIDSLKNAKARSRVLVIDACRENPFVARGVRSIGASGGIALLPAPEGTLIMYSAADGQTALDSLGANDRAATSVYTRTLLKHLTTPGESMVEIAREVRREVADLAKTVGHEQRPSYYDELSDDLRLSPGATAPAPIPVPGPTVAVVVPSRPLAQTPPLVGIDLPGSDYRNFDLAAADAAQCQNACKAESQCIAWTYVRPGVQGPKARCWLKNKAPQRAANNCCTSGIERAETK